MSRFNHLYISLYTIIRGMVMKDMCSYEYSHNYGTPFYNRSVNISFYKNLTLDIRFISSIHMEMLKDKTLSSSTENFLSFRVIRTFTNSGTFITKVNVNRYKYINKTRLLLINNRIFRLFMVNFSL